MKLTDEQVNAALSRVTDYDAGILLINHIDALTRELAEAKRDEERFIRLHEMIDELDIDERQDLETRVRLLILRYANAEHELMGARAANLRIRQENGKLAEANDWPPVTPDSPTPEDGDVLVMIRNSDVRSMTVDGRYRNAVGSIEWWDGDYEYSHWRPLPEGPKL